jgi:hypothetical protein
MNDHQSPAKKMLYKLKNKYFTSGKTKKASERRSIMLKPNDSDNTSEIKTPMRKTTVTNVLDTTSMIPLRQPTMSLFDGRKGRKQHTVGAPFNFSKKGKSKKPDELPITIHTEVESWWSKFSEKMEKYLHSGPFAIFTTFVIIVELFVEDFRVIFFPKETDIYVDHYIFASALFFVVEMLASCFFVKNYLFSFFNFVDILSTASLSPYFSIYLDEHFHHQEYTYENTDGNILTMFFKNTHITKASKASLAGTRLSRIYSIFKVLRVFSLGRIYKHNLDALVKKNEEIIIKHKNKQKIKTQRRKSVQIHSLEDRLKFFKQVHQVLNIPESAGGQADGGKRGDPGSSNKDISSNINPVIIKNFYEYAVKNEIKRESEKKDSIVRRRMDVMLKEESGYEDPINTVYEEGFGTNAIINEILKDGDFKSRHSGTNFCKCQNQSPLNTIVSATNDNHILIKIEKKEEVCKECGMPKLKNQLMESVKTFVDNDDEEDREEDIKEIENVVNDSQMNKSKEINSPKRKDSAFKFLNKFNISPIRKPNLRKFKTYDEKQIPQPEIKEIEPLDKIDLRVQKEADNKVNEKEEDYTMKFFNDFKNPNGEHGTKLSISISKAFTMRVVLIVLFVLFLDPFVSLDNYTTSSDLYSYQLDVLANYLATNNIDAVLSSINKITTDEQFMEDNDFELIELGFTDINIRNDYNLTDLFPVDMIYRNETVYNNTRMLDRVYINNPYFYLIYNNIHFNDLIAIFNMMKILFIAGCLWLFSFIFVYDVNNVVIVPLEELFDVMRNRKIENESLYYNVDKAIEDDMKRYTHLYEDILSIERFFRQMSYLIVKVIGIRFYDFFRPRLVEDDNDAAVKKASRTTYDLKGYIMVIKISNFNGIITKLGEDSVPLISKIVGIIDLAVFENYGEILKINHDTIIVFFDRSYLENLEGGGGGSCLLNFKQKSQNIKTYLANSSLLSAIHIISRVKTLITDYQGIDMNISLHKGKINSFLVNTDSMIDMCIYSKNLKKVLQNLVI